MNEKDFEKQMESKNQEIMNLNNVIEGMRAQIE